ncbi:type VI secretion system baseplate subunit TssE [Corallococcus sp. BB11-1]|uniref:type VI secretion system baseplate subunit TssE n=1 Tax=Corallococcus sp. BB11-1 TaxID=2996783 RepID=UPI0022718683|nr:type VI secretion system baseplate subunit TssE [Corallococcus sp. BB11-1]MCY1033885.1 type VI secretion system baseplate subunit TssE [Corallococcus sp. BB11-1]
MAEREKEAPVSPALLFDRLGDHEPWQSREVRPPRVLSREELELSVRMEVQQLLNTRCYLTVAQAEALGASERSVVDYGVPEMQWMNPASKEDQVRLEKVLSRTLAAFEPRLRQPRACVASFDSEQRMLRVTVSASLVVDRLAEPVSFQVKVDLQGGGHERE